MRLIDADKLRFLHQVKCNTNTTRPYTLNCISFDEVQNAPTIKAVPIDMLDKIRAEITAIAINGQIDEHTMFIRSGEQVKQMALEIIDKYRNEVNE